MILLPALNCVLTYIGHLPPVLNEKLLIMGHWLAVPNEKLLIMEHRLPALNERFQSRLVIKGTTLSGRREQGVQIATNLWSIEQFTW